ncbi:MAG: hypothetical protein HFJ91_00360 [Muribaculaceae bacterium]|nr:hypothetical protein [Muribaculaceae bacterium]
MRYPVIITARVIDTINSLSANDRGPISNALTMEFILGQNPESTLTPMQNVVYAILRFYVKQDMERSREKASGDGSFTPCRCALG